MTKSPMEASGYAAALADLTGEAEPLAWFEEGVLQVRTPDGPVVPIRAAFRYVTQRPWARIQVTTRR